MRRLILQAGFLVTSVCTLLNSATLISGNIDGIAFDPAKNPYIVEKDIIVPKGRSVIIPEGIVLLFKPFTGFQVSGRLAVQGSADRLAIFSSINDNTYNPEADQLPNPFDWNGIFISKDADGAYLNHFSLKYSVYGVKSQCKNIIIQNAVFQQNGQFHFTVNEQIQMVQDNIPFSYGDSVAEGPSSTSNAPGKGNKKSAAPAKKSQQSTSGSNHNKKVKIFRFTSLGVGVVGGAVAVISAVQMNQHIRNQDAIRRDGGTKEQWEAEDSKRKSSSTGVVIGSIIGGLGVVGFGISFAF